MTNQQQHPITPSPELVAQWLKQFYGPTTRLGTLAPGEASLHVATAAAQWGADQELEACCEWTQSYAECGDSLRAARRPKPPPKPPTAIEIIDLSIEIDDAGLGIVDVVRAALERWGHR